MTLTLRRSRWLVGLCSALLVVTASGQGGPPPQPVSVRPVVNAQLAPVTWVPGTVVARADSRLGAEVSGRLVSLAEVGTSVAKGEAMGKFLRAAASGAAGVVSMLVDCTPSRS